MNSPQADMPVEPSDPLSQLTADYPQYHIWREDTADGRGRYIARSQHLGINPHTVVTTDPAELRTALSNADAQPHAARSQHAGSTARQFDPAVAHPARVYNVWLGGKDNYPADRQAAAEVEAHRPQVVAGARANRAFLGRVVRYLACRQGIRQFIDVGPGLPAPEATHSVAQAIAPESRVVYVDNDPLVLVYARALLTSQPEGECDYVDADLRNPATILKEVARTLDLTRPVGVLLVAVVHFLPDADDPASIVVELASALAPGSCIAISHLTADAARDAVSSGVAAYNARVSVGLTARSHAGVTALFGSLSLIPPGVVPVSQWRPDHATPFHMVRGDMYGGVGLKTGRSR